MKIYYDYELEDYPNKRVLPPMVASLVDELRDFFIGKLSVFSDTMKEQEDYFGSYVLITMITTPQPSFGFVNYAPSLKKKMEASFTQQDWDYISLKLSHIIAQFLN